MPWRKSRTYRRARASAAALAVALGIWVAAIATLLSEIEDPSQAIAITVVGVFVLVLLGDAFVGKLEDIAAQMNESAVRLAVGSMNISLAILEHHMDELTEEEREIARTAMELSKGPK